MGVWRVAERGQHWPVGRGQHWPVQRPGRVTSVIAAGLSVYLPHEAQRLLAQRLRVANVAGHDLVEGQRGRVSRQPRAKICGDIEHSPADRVLHLHQVRVERGGGESRLRGDHRGHFFERQKRQD